VVLVQKGTRNGEAIIPPGLSMLPNHQEHNSNSGEEGPQELDLLGRISDLVDSVHTSRERFLQVMALLDDAFGNRYGTLTLSHPTKGKTVLEVAFGDLGADEGCIGGLKPSVVDEILMGARPVALSRRSQDFLSIPLRSLQEKDASLICVPIMNRTQAMGVLTVNPIYRDTVSLDRDIRLLKIIAALAFRDAPLPEDQPSGSETSLEDPPLDQILEEKLGRMIEKVDPRTESRCALLPDIVRLVEKIVIKRALKRHHNIQSAASLFLGINRNTLRKKMRDLNIHFDQIR
jgi:transcriptional regulator with GAF, ATPase, and Fis domain